MVFFKKKMLKNPQIGRQSNACYDNGKIVSE